MSAINLMRVTVWNFRSFGSTPVTVQYQDLNNLTLVFSEINGAGKSTLFVQAPVYALTGKAYNNKSKIGNLVNLKNNKRSVVELEFKAGKDIYVVRRGQKPKLFELYKNGTLMDTAIDYQKQLNEIIGKEVSFDMLINTIILSSSRYTPFRKQTKKQREEFLDFIFRTHVYNPMVSENKSHIKAENLVYEELKTNINHTLALVNTKKSAIEEFNRTQQSISKDIKSKVIELNHNRIAIQTQLDSLIDNTNNLNSSNSVLRELNSERNELMQIIHSTISEQKNKMAIVQLDKCGTCLQDVGNEIKSEIKSAVKVELEGVAIHKDKLASIEQKIKEANLVQSEHADTQSKYIQDRSRLQSELRMIETQVQSYQSQITSQNSKFKESIDGYKAEVKVLTKELKHYDLKRNEVLKNLDVYTEAQQFLGNVNIRKEIMSKYIPHINKILNDYLVEMEFFIEVQIDEDYNIIVTSVSKEGLSIHDLSDGERSKIDLAFILVWKNIQDSITQDLIDIFVLDETLANFSPQAVKDFLALVKKVLPKHKTIVILQHPNDFIEVFDDIVEIKVENEFSYIDEDTSENPIELENIFNTI